MEVIFIFKNILEYHWTDPRAELHESMAALRVQHDVHVREARDRSILRAAVVDDHLAI